MKKITKVFISVMLLFFVAGCSSSEEPAKESTKVYSNNGMSITLPDKFYEKDMISFTNYYESDDTFVTALKESFKDLESIGLNSKSSLEDYAKIILKGNKLDSKLYTSEDNKYMYFTYENEISEKEFYYMGVVYKTDDAFWLINFACEKDNKSKYSDTFVKWADTVKFE